MNNNNITDIIIPSISIWWNVIKKAETYNVSNWQNWVISSIANTLKDGGLTSSWIEIEYLPIGNDWIPRIVYEWKIIPLPTDTRFIKEIESYRNGEVDINRMISNFWEGENAFRDDEAFLSIELRRGTQELSFANGYNIKSFFRTLISTLGELDDFLGSQDLTMYLWWNMPYTAPNINNYSNKYYEYLIKVRDKNYNLWDHRWNWIQYHVAMENYNQAIYTYNNIRHILPLFLALWANSPFWDGEHRWFLSERMQTKAEIYKEKTGIPEQINEDYLTHLQEQITKWIKTVTPFYYDIRYPRVDIKTLENCTPDTVNDIWLMFAMYDIYFRVAQKLKKNILDGTKNNLPSELFGQQEVNNSHQEQLNNNMKQVNVEGTNANIQIDNTNISVKETLEILLRWIEDIPCQLPDFIRTPLNIPNETDATNYIISEILNNGNLAEKTLKDFGIKRRKNKIIRPNLDEIKKYMHNSWIEFREQLFMVRRELNNTLSLKK